MSKKLTIPALVTALACGALSLLADSAAPVADKAQQEAAIQEQIQTLIAMPAAERRAELKKMSPAERQGLWFRVKQAQHAERGVERGSYKNVPGKAAAPKAPRLPAKAVGTITYDDGVITNSFGGGSIIGNRFDTHDGGVQVTASGTVDTVVAVVVQGPTFTTSSAGFVLLGPQTVGGGAFAVFSTFTGATGMTDTVTFNGMGASYTGSSFFVLFGDFANSYVPAFGTGTNNGQGHHGVVGYTGGMGPNITGTFDFGGTLNGLVRATGNILPVELTSFEVD